MLSVENVPPVRSRLREVVELFVERVSPLAPTLLLLLTLSTLAILLLLLLLLPHTLCEGGTGTTGART